MPGRAPRAKRATASTLSEDSRRPGPRKTLPADPIGRLLGWLALALALAGGAVLVALAVATCLSVLGRALISRPIPGDFELIEIGCAVAVFAFLPYCQLVGGHAVVDFFTDQASPRARAWLDGLGNLAFTLIAGVLTWRATLGGLDLRRYQETTMVLGIPSWWGYVPACISLALLTLVCAYTAWRSLAQASAAGALGRGPAQ